MDASLLHVRKEECSFNEYCAVLFHKGALLNDTHGILIQKTENVQAGNQIQFTNLQAIVEMEPILKTYIYEAIEVEKAGLEVNFESTTEFTIPIELQRKFDDVSGLKTAFDALTPGRQRAYILISRGRNNPKLGSYELKNVYSRFSMERE